MDAPQKKKKTAILISACLIGIPCRYDGAGNRLPQAEDLKKRYNLIPFCPECYGGLATPRPPAEIQADGRVCTQEGLDVSEAFDKGAQHAVTICQDFSIRYALLKANSPSCGPTTTYDGSFSHTLTNRSGLTAKALIEHGVKVYSELDFPYDDDLK